LLILYPKLLEVLLDLRSKPHSLGVEVFQTASSSLSASSKPCLLLNLHEPEPVHRSVGATEVLGLLLIG